MRKLGIVAALLLATGVAQAREPASLPAWMSGCWTQNEGKRWTEECWMQPRGGIMLGAGRNGKAEQLQSWEVTRIERDAQGGLVYWGSPRGATPVAFPAISQSPIEITFANLKHDYPQRIRYWREGDDLLAEISMADGSKAIRWHYRRVN